MSTKKANFFVLCLVLFVCTSWVSVSDYLTLSQAESDWRFLPCTFGIFRRFQRKHHELPGQGSWTKSEDDIDFYNLDTCKLQPRVNPSFIARCFAKGSVKSVVTIGDSNGKKFYEGLLRTFGGTRAVDDETCPPLKLEEWKTLDVDPSYYNTSDKWVQYMNTRFRHCNSCSSALRRCKLRENSDSQQNTATVARYVDVEHLGMSQIVDDSIVIHKPTLKRHEVGNFWAPSALEYYLRYHLFGHYPDILIFFLMTPHIKAHLVERIAVDLEVLSRFIELYVPQSTKVFYINGAAEYENKYKYANTRSIYENRTRTATEQIVAINRRWYKIMQQRFLTEGDRNHGFLDLVTMSMDRGNWSTDGAHMIPTWYDSVMSMFWNTYCNSVFGNDF